MRKERQVLSAAEETLAFTEDFVSSFALVLAAVAKDVFFSVFLGAFFERFVDLFLEFFVCPGIPLVYRKKAKKSCLMHLGKWKKI